MATQLAARDAAQACADVQLMMFTDCVVVGSSTLCRHAQTPSLLYRKSS